MPKARNKGCALSAVTALVRLMAAVAAISQVMIPVSLVVATKVSFSKSTSEPAEIIN